MTNLKFEELNLSPELQKAIADAGYTQATPIQSLSIPFLLEGRDVIGQAQTGTGKTAAFGIPVIEHIDENDRDVQALIMCPTRELAMQVADEIEKLSRHKKRVRVLAVYGGASIEKQIQALRKGVHIVVGTPGRIMDHLDRGTLHLDFVRQVVLDEADEMLDMGFREDIEAILSEVPEERQTIFFSATMPKPILELTKKYQTNPEIIKVVKDELTVAAIDQRYIEIRERDKVAVMQRLIDLHEPKLCLVFCNTKRKVDELVGEMQAQGFFAEALHGDMRQATRSQVMAKFRQGVIQVLVATDVAARGIDVDDIEMVINYDVPLDAEYYVHRIGRTGRAGRAGHAFTFVTNRERSQLFDIERYAKTKIAREAVPSMKDIEAKKKKNFLGRIKSTASEGELDKYRAWVRELEEEGFTAMDVASALIKLEIHHQITGVENIEQPSFGGSERGGDLKRGRTKGGDKMARLFINLGRKMNVGPKDILGAIAGEAGLEGRQVGSIDIYDKFSFVEVPEEVAEHVIKRMKKTQIRGNKFNIEVATEEGKGQERKSSKKSWR